MRIIKQTLDKIRDLKRPMKRFLSEMVSTILSNHGKINFSRYCNYHEKGISRNFRSTELMFTRF